ncbi:NACHT domain- and WD repeat-containing protein 1-like isoform X2 [Ptychodera flava]|uniref:NACHT domain- and WD repeat-containing protein 1-like isoform X2 n=1 Tax=Ptychodera flava TaxID=63121 RepID=UPI003969BF41
MYSSKNKLEATEKLFKDVSVDPKARLTQGRPMYSSPEGGRSVSFPPVPTGQRFSSPTKVGYSSSLQGRDLGLAPNPSLAEEIGDRHWRIPERRLRQRNDRKIVRYLRKQLRKRMQQYYEDEEYEDGFETIDEKPEKVPTETNPGPFVKYQEGNGKKDIFSQYNDVGGRLSKEGSFVDNGPFPPRVVKSPNLKKLYELQSEQTETDETEVDRVKAPSPVVNGFHAKGVTFAEQEFEIVGRSETPRPKSASELSVLSISSNSSNRQVPDSLPDICTTPVPSQNGQESPPQSSLDDGKKIKLPAISKATPKEKTAGTPDEGYMDAVESELRKVEERPDTRSSVESVGIQRPAFTPVQTPYPLPVGRSDTCDYLKLNYKDTVDAIVKGRLDVKCHINKRIIRMYISSNISDSEAERNGLMEKVYPQLRLYCKERGYAFQMIDPNWALKDAIVDNHSHQELCLKELNTARDISMGPNFVTFLSQKYGQCVIPTTIPVEEFKKFISLMQSGKESYLASHVNRNVAGLEKEKTSDSLKSNTDDKTTENQTQNSEEESEDKKESEDKGEASAEGTQENQVTSQETDEALERRKTDREYDAEMSILNMWYKLDDNMVPPVYRLQPISSQYRDINHRDKFRRTTAKQHWTSQCKRLEAIFLNYIKDVTDDQQRIDEYIKSTIEREIEEGILNLKDKPYDTVQWFRRNITDLKYNLTDFSAKDYIDLVTDENDQTEIDMVKTKRLHDLMDQKMPSKVSLAQMHEYSVSWHQDGIKPDKNRGHLLYVDKMCNDLFSIIRGKIDHSIQKKTASRDAKKRLYDEITPHVTFVRERSRDFNGRKEVLNRIKEYVRVGPRKPLIIHGKSGYGKTSVMAKAAKDAPSWIKSGDPAVVVRMIGVTGDSVHIRQLLRSMSLQLCYIFGQDTSLVPQDYRGALNDFNSRLASATPERPLFVFLDSLDQLSDENNGHALQWLPLELPENVYMVVSTLTEDTYDTFKTVKRLFGNSDNFVEIPELPESDAVFILEHLLEQESRTLTDEQHDAVLKAFRNCPSPLYLRLVFEETRLWRSYSTEKEIWVPTAISKIINMLFSRMETQHGEPFVRRALGYITAARSGVTESELLDLLSLDDLVLGDVSNHFPLPVRRFPPVLWMRLRHDLQWYLVEHSADYEWTYQWSHVQLHQAAVERYLNQKDKAPSYHTALSELFMGVWADKKKPYPGRDAGSLRYVDSQALSHTIVSPTGKVKTLFNLRTVNELPYHLINSNQFEKLKKKVLLNFDWLLAKVRATSLRAVLDDFHNAMLIEPGDKELKLLADCLQLSETALLRNPLELATQVVGRLNDIIRKDKPISIGDPKKYPNMGRFMRQAKNAAIAGFIPSVTCLTPPGDVMYDLLAGHTDVITAVTASMDGTIAMTASKDKTMKLWDFRTGRVTKTIEGTGDQIHAIRLCLNNMYAVTAETGCIRFWNMRNSQCQLAVDDLIDPASITAAGNNSQIVVAFYFGVNIMRSWDLENDFQRLQDVKYRKTRVASTKIGHCAFLSIQVVIMSCMRFVAATWPTRGMPDQENWCIH